MSPLLSSPLYSTLHFVALLYSYYKYYIITYSVSALDLKLILEYLEIIHSGVYAVHNRSRIGTAKGLQWHKHYITMLRSPEVPPEVPPE